MTWLICLFKGGDSHVPLIKRAALSGIDRFLFLEEWDEQFGSVIQVALPRSISDHCLIKLCSNSIDRGPRPFRFVNCWLKKKNFLALARSWWSQREVRGYAGVQDLSKASYPKRQHQNMEQRGVWSYKGIERSSIQSSRSSR